MVVSTAVAVACVAATDHTGSHVNSTPQLVCGGPSPATALADVFAEQAPLPTKDKSKSAWIGLAPKSKFLGWLRNDMANTRDVLAAVTAKELKI